MIAYRNISNIENPNERNGGPVWNRLHSEREDVCEALLKEGVANHAAAMETPTVNHDAIRNWHTELLQARLHKIDEALDRLMTGSYGNCCKCERWIQDSKLDFDPAVAFCVECWERVQTSH